MLNRSLQILEKIILPQPRPAVGGENEYWRAVISASGSTLINIIRLRKNSRGVFLVEHPLHGKCILKTSCSVRASKKGFANMAIAKVLEESNPGIFPRVLEIAPSYTLEEKIYGIDFFHWLRKDYDTSAIEAYFKELKKWSINCAGSEHKENLLVDEIRIITNKYFHKCMSHLKYRSPAERLHSLYIFSKRRKRLAEQSEWLWKAAGDINLPKGMMCGDMGADNIMVESKSNRFFNVDYEHLGIGYHGFDTSYFLVSILRQKKMSSMRQQLFDLLLTNKFLDGQMNVEYFRNLTDLLVEIDTIIFFPKTISP